MTATQEPRDVLTTRLVVLDDLVARLLAIKAGLEVAPGLSTERFVNSIKTVFWAPDAVATIIDSELPAVALWDLGTIFTENADGSSSAAVWRMALLMIIRDDGSRDQRNSDVYRLVEVLWHDVKRALMVREACQAGGADVNITPTAFAVELEQPDCGLGWAELEITYEDVMVPL